MIPTVKRYNGGWRRFRMVPDPLCLRAIRENAGLTRRAVAEKAGVRKEYVYQVERGIEGCSERLRLIYEEIRA